jgi:hypothetical protein
VQKPSSAEDPVERALLECLVHEAEHRPAFLRRGVEAWMRPGAVREACRFVAGLPDAASALPVDAAPEPVRKLLTEVLVSEGGPRSAFEAIEATLCLRDLEARSARLVVEMRKAEARGDPADVERLQREKMELDRIAAACRRR